MCNKLLVIALGICLAGCKAENQYTNWFCRFAYNNAEHLDATLNTALNPNAPGTFCLITEGMYGGVKTLYFENNQGMKSSKQENILEQNADYVLGLNNGIIVGFCNNLFDSFGNYQFVAYDQQCPNCVESTGNDLSPTFRVVMSTEGIATCSKCSRRYDMNNGGVLLNAEKANEKYLQRYKNALTSGQNGHVSVFR